jgi:hypothetical protein
MNDAGHFFMAELKKRLTENPTLQGFFAKVF